MPLQKDDPLRDPGFAAGPGPPAALGLSAREAARRLREDGANEPAGRTRRTLAAQVASQFVNPLILILLAAGALSFVLGEPVNGTIIATMVVLSIALNFLQAYRSTKAADALREGVAPRAAVCRDGTWLEVPRREVVKGDLIRLSAGDLVPADAELVEERDLHVNEAMLTGESLPVEKLAIPGAETSRLFLGTSVVSGTASAVVTATGAGTVFGDVVARLSERPPENAFERGTREFGVLIMRTVVALVLFVLLVSILLRRDPLESLLFAVALAVGLTPEFLPMITTVTLGQGAVRMARQKVIVKHLAAMQNFGSIDILCSDKTGTLTAGRMTLAASLDGSAAPSETPRRLAFVNSFFQTGIRSPLDAAILAAPGLDAAGYRKLDEIPFDFERRRLSVVVESGGRRVLIAKGAPEGILPLCESVEAGGAVLPFDAAGRARGEEAYRMLCEQGQRVLAVASRTLPERAAYGRQDELGLTLDGFLAFDDPPLEDAAQMLAALARDGIAVKILTGDNELVARHVCARVGLDTERLVLGDELDRASDAALGPVCEQATIFARVSPRQKNRIILALKSRGHVVGFLGDGINDAPSLHAADVGISVATGVDVARDAADIILLEPGLRVLHTGIIEGRKAFGNVMKYLLMGTSSNFGNMFSMAAASLLLPFLPMLPTQILLNNFLYDLAQVTIPTDHVDETYIRKPQRWNIRLIRNFMIAIGPVSSVFDFATFFVLLRLFPGDQVRFHTGWFVESLATQTLVLFVIRTAGNPFKSRPSAALTATTLLVVVIGVVLPYSPLADTLGFRPLPGSFLLLLAGLTLAYLVIVNLVKGRLMRRLAAA